MRLLIARCTLFLLFYPASAPLAQNVFQNHLSAFVSDSLLLPAHVGFSAFNLTTGEKIGSFNENKLFLPASVLKVATTFTALQHFPDDHRFQTTIEYTGTLSKGIVSGNLIIRGGGDPTLGSSYFSSNPSGFLTDWVKAIKEAGISRINGNLVLDNSYFPAYSIPAGWSWGDIGNYYAPSVEGLNVFDNSFSITFSSGKAGDTARIVRVEPSELSLQVINEVTLSVEDGDKTIIYHAPYGDTALVRGTLPAGVKSRQVKGSIPDPAKLLGRVLQAALLDAGVLISGAVITSREPVPAGKLIHRHLSPSLAEVISITNLKSVNLFAEALLLHSAKKRIPEKLNTGHAELLEAVFDPMDSAGIHPADGSGLARSNLASPAAYLGLLKRIHRSPFYKVIYASLPVAGVSGSIADIGRSTILEGNLRAKSGYLTGSRCYAGYLRNKKKEEIAFVLFVNNFTAKPLQVKRAIEKLLIKLADT